ncbi:uncharacterized protein MELLADRAFT_91786 [Melampsora larici-populina 98AG31]|uniref:Uncharacterized protein n=1 Tax=Melampsora larici-populina (strain 98AG31 / pathotype 3-4-7) TaxID=747676 RepID=F4S0A7_MELLP|nr:uncharacterized protein MELLADRAFT_91786 [Melampsora larici-populina 98AG31]EGG01971.1 hypothetical protein MELLADRAFT_91786 [Melampsora larici-populina 98AG31]
MQFKSCQREYICGLYTQLTESREHSCKIVTNSTGEPRPAIARVPHSSTTPVPMAITSPVIEYSESWTATTSTDSLRLVNHVVQLAPSAAFMGPSTR